MHGEIRAKLILETLVGSESHCQPVVHLCHSGSRPRRVLCVTALGPRADLALESDSFPNGITAENILDHQNPRNRRLAEAFARCGLIERSGQGMDRMFEESIRQSKPLPDFSGSDEHRVRLILRGEVQNPAFIKFLEKVGSDRLAGFTIQDFLALDYIQREQSVPAALRPRLPQLIDLGVIESVGRGRGVRHLLSKAFYAHLDQKGSYTRKRGLDRETNKALLLKHITDSAQDGARFEEFQQVLPALSRQQIATLLRELRGARRIHNAGIRKAARWFPGLPAAKNHKKS